MGEVAALTAYQRAILAGLTLGTPGIARLYLLICQHPGISLEEAKRLSHERYGVGRRSPVVTRRADQLEDIGAAYSVRERRGKANIRALYAYRIPPTDGPDLIARVLEDAPIAYALETP